MSKIKTNPGRFKAGDADLDKGVFPRWNPTSTTDLVYSIILVFARESLLTPFRQKKTKGDHILLTALARNRPES
jgi:hypothetical protein